MVSKQCSQAMLTSNALSKASSMSTYVTDGTNEEQPTLSSYLTLSIAHRGGTRFGQFEGKNSRSAAAARLAVTHA